MQAILIARVMQFVSVLTQQAFCCVCVYILML